MYQQKLRGCLSTSALALLMLVGSAGGRSLFAQRSSLDHVRWLAGCWELSSGTRRVVERWAAPAGGIMTGSSRTSIAGAPRESEQLRLFVRADTLVYEAHPSGQRLTEFSATTVGPREIVFENPAHDFPQRIVYTRVGEDSVIARIEGDRAGRRNPVSFPYRKVACTPDTPTAGEVARAQLAPLYQDLIDREAASGGGTNAWMAAHAAPGFVYLLWTTGGPQVPMATADMLARAAAGAQNPAAQAIRDRGYEHTIERIFARGDSASVLVTERRSWKFPDAAGRYGPAGEYRERRAVERRIDRWIRVGEAWRLAESALVGAEIQIDGTITLRDGRPVP